MFYQWPKETVTIICKLIVSGIKEELSSNKLYRNNRQRIVKPIKAILKQKSDYAFCMWGLITPKN